MKTNLIISIATILAMSGPGITEAQFTSPPQSVASPV